MPSEPTDKGKRRSIGRIKKFDVKEYLDNRPMIEKLYEEKQQALAKSDELEEKVKSLEAQVHELKLKNQKLSMQLDETRRQSFIMFALSLLAAILVGIGVNIVTDKPYGWAGWVMIASSALLELIGFLIVRGQRD